jgi:hypothetical protein
MECPDLQRLRPFIKRKGASQENNLKTQVVLTGNLARRLHDPSARSGCRKDRLKPAGLCPLTSRHHAVCAIRSRPRFPEGSLEPFRLGVVVTDNQDSHQRQGLSKPGQQEVWSRESCSEPALEFRSMPLRDSSRAQSHRPNKGVQHPLKGERPPCSPAWPSLAQRDSPHLASFGGQSLVAVPVAHPAEALPQSLPGPENPAASKKQAFQR